MNEEQRQNLLHELLRATNEADLKEVVERHLTKLDNDFTRWLLGQIVELRAADLEKALHVEMLYGFIQRLKERGDYRKAQFDEFHPENPKEILLALARRVERGKLDLEAAVDQGVGALSKCAGSTLRWDWSDLSLSLTSAPDPAVHVSLGELMYQIGRQLTQLASMSVYGTAMNTRSAEAMKLRSEGKFEEELRVYNRITVIAEENQDWQNLCGVFMSIGDVYHYHLISATHPDRLNRAEQYYSRALQVCDEADLGPTRRATILIELGKAIGGQGRIKEGMDRLQECLSLRLLQTEVDQQVIKESLEAIIEVSVNSGTYAAAKTYLEEAIPLATNDDARAQILAHLALALNELAEAGADDAIADAIRLADQSSDPQLRGSVYNIAGTYRTRTGDWQGAIDAYQVAIEEAGARGDEKEEARRLSNLGKVYLVLGQKDKAASLFDQAAQIHVPLKDYMGVANLSVNLGYRFLSEGRFARAAQVFAYAFASFHQAQQPTQMAFTALHLSQVYQKLGDLTRAEAAVRYCLSKADAAGSLRHKCYALTVLGNLLAEQGNVKEAATTYRQAIALVRQVGEVAIEQQARTTYGKFLEENLSAPDKAEKEYRHAIELLEMTRGGFRATDSRILFQSRSDEAYTRLVRLLVRQQHRAGAIGEAFTFTERARSRTLVELLSRRPVRWPDSLPPDLAQREKELLGELRRIEESGELGLELAQRHNRLKRELEQVWQQMASIDEACKAYVELRRTPTIKVADTVRLLEV